MTSRRFARVTIAANFDVFRQAVEQARGALAELEPEVAATNADRAGRCELCHERADQLVRIVEDGADRDAANAGHRICPDCASERPTILMPVYPAPDNLDIDCSHLSAFLIVTGERFGQVGCIRCATSPIPNAALLARRIDPNRPHGDQPSLYEELVTCFCERCVENPTEQLAVRLNMPWPAVAELVGS